MSTYGKIKTVSLIIIGFIIMLAHSLIFFGVINEDDFVIISWLPLFALLILAAPASKEDLESDKASWEKFKETGIPSFYPGGAPIIRWGARGALAVLFLTILVVELNAFFTE